MIRSRASLPAAPWVATAGLLVALGTSAAAVPAPAPGGRGLLPALEGEGGSAGVGVVGRIEEVRRLDTRGFTASLAVSRTLGPDAALAAGGEPIRIAWEELATGRPPRFAEGDRVLVVVEPLGTASIWAKRIPDPGERGRILGVAAAGDAFLRDPALASLDALHHYLAARAGGATGAGSLATLAAGAQLPLAAAAAHRLGELPGVEADLDAGGEAAVAAALERPDADPQLTAALLTVLDHACSRDLEQRLARRAGDRARPAPPRVFHGLARCRLRAPGAGSGLQETEWAWLLARSEAEYRRVGALAAGPNDLARLRALLADDPEPAVRAAALARLAELVGDAVLPDALASLADPAPAVRAVAVHSAAALGENAVPSLRAVVYGTWAGCCQDSDDARRAAVAALRQAGPAGRRAVAEIAASHPDPALRKLAELALGDTSGLGGHGH